ncbi:MAG TPA: type II toxin-antitoxin system RelE/ParE family toxin [Bacteroidetes bacterium]|nr:plasmid stabilization system protein [bacterium BMS3Bbin04]HDO66484.1 type II toxin-antitoxin system RelE/ParE family toxin [Bacteroidota bacterium]HEX05609.1 type II toxin-antitoxin system RelE/ParE family toxin [Bacteroidota bacterium]
MSFQVKVTPGAANDLDEILTWIRENDSDHAARQVFNNLVKSIESLAKFPHRGRPARELAEWGAPGYREIRYASFRILYHVEGDTVFVRFIVHERRDLLDLLERRLLE